MKLINIFFSFYFVFIVKNNLCQAENSNDNLIINSNLKHKNAKKSFHPLSVEYLIGEENNTETNRSNTLNEDEINNQENSSVLNRDSLINLLDDIKAHVINVENKFQNEIGKKKF